ncbi:MAG: putative metal-binding motif-containing protein [Polyangiaceae bacterium]|nr:putative metal-binding motif-containing protein [Polyangiaceae bacterium]
MLHQRSFSIIGLFTLALFAACAADDGYKPGSKNKYDPDAGDANDSEFGVGEVDLTKPCTAGPHDDLDGDGWTIAQGDCNDCVASVNPGAFDVPGNNYDDDCDGIIDNGLADCDMGLAINDNDPMNGARAMDLCRTTTATDKNWGVLSAKYVKVDGTPGMADIGRGLLPSFGVNSPKRGSAMLALSTGAARGSGQPGFSTDDVEHGTKSNPPEGYPKESPACPGVQTGDCNDPAALELEIRVPTNARSFSFNLNFFTREFPVYICSQYNDFFVTMMWPQHPGLPDPNISFDADNNPISVNNSLLQVCEPQNAGGKNFPCPQGPASLAGTGFDGAGGIFDTQKHAATGWLLTSAPVTPGSIIKLRFAIWDSGDGVLDSTVLLDNFMWDTETVEAIETVPIIK